MKMKQFTIPVYKIVFKNPSHLCFLFFIWILLALYFNVSLSGAEVLHSFDPALSGARICLSLRVLASQVQANTRKSQIREMAGLGWLEGYVIDPENRDIILIGRRHPNWPYIHLDDLVANLRNVWYGNPDPYCSLDPRSEDIKKMNRISADLARAKGRDQKQKVFKKFKKAVGPQKVIVGGVPRNSRYAHIMIDADYHMKKLSKAIVSIPGIPSCLDLQLQSTNQAIKNGKNPEMGLSMSRFWFHVDEDDPVFQEDEGVVWLDRCSVVVLTEKQRADSDGDLYDSGEDDPISRLFAGNLTKRFREISHRVPVYAQLENLFRLNAIFRAMHFQNAVREAKLDIRFLLEKYQYQADYKMPDSLKGLANSKTLEGSERKGNRIEEYILTAIACGGVSMEMPVQKERFVKPPDTSLDRFRKDILSSRPGLDSLTWTIP